MYNNSNLFFVDDCANINKQINTRKEKRREKKKVEQNKNTGLQLRTIQPKTKNQIHALIIITKNIIMFIINTNQIFLFYNINTNGKLFRN